MLYYTGRSRIYWLRNQEENITAMLKTLLATAGVDVTQINQVLIGEGFQVATRIAKYGVQNQGRYFALSHEYDHCYYLTNNLEGDHLFVARYCNECGMSDLNLEPYPRNVNLFLQCIDKMIDDYDHADTWTQEQRDVLNKYIGCLYSHHYIDFALMIFETLRQIESNPEVKDYLLQEKYLRPVPYSTGGPAPRIPAGTSRYRQDCHHEAGRR